MVCSEYRGNKIICENNIWIYKDTKEPVKSNPNRECGCCGSLSTKEGHDRCLGTLPGIMNACCGHGSEDKCYVQFNSSFSVNGKHAINIINILKRLK